MSELSYCGFEPDVSKKYIYSTDQNLHLRRQHKKKLIFEKKYKFIIVYVQTPELRYNKLTSTSFWTYVEEGVKMKVELVPF